LSIDIEPTIIHTELNPCLRDLHPNTPIGLATMRVMLAELRGQIKFAECDTIEKIEINQRWWTWVLRRGLFSDTGLGMEKKNGMVQS